MQCVVMSQGKSSEVYRFTNGIKPMDDTHGEEFYTSEKTPVIIMKRIYYREQLPPYFQFHLQNYCALAITANQHDHILQLIASFALDPVPTHDRRLPQVAITRSPE